MMSLKIRYGILMLMMVLGMPGAASAAPAATPTGTPDGTAVDDSPRPEVLEDRLSAGDAQTPNLQLTLKALGARYPINLRGVNDSDAVPFNIRSDRVVTQAALDLRFIYSPALLSPLSHLNILVNDEVAYSVPVPKKDAGINLRRSIPIPAYMITEHNRLRLQLIGHYTERCEDPLHSSLWANISNLSTLQLVTTPVRLDNDLSLLPVPFFDPRDQRRLSLPFVFIRHPDAATLEAAGMVASWFGALAGPRGADFPAEVDTAYPEQGNAIVFALSGPQNADEWGLDISGPTLSIQTNPNDPFGKLLVITGRDSRELKQAALGLVLGQATLTGQTAALANLATVKPRQPYDAPRWVPTDRPVKIGEWVDPESLNTRGYDPASIQVPLRLPPDLFPWRADPVKMNLKYRYTPQVGEVNSSLIVKTDNELLKSIPLLSIDQLKQRGWTQTMQAYDLLPGELTVDVPLDRLLARSELRFHYMYDYIKEGECRDTIIDNVRGSIDPNTTLDFSGYPHFMAMPNLAAFDQAGFPFTRMADLSETAVALSGQPAPEEISTYLYLLGRFGESTGYPAAGVTVAFGPQGLAQNDKDLLIINTDMAQTLRQWNDAMPVKLQGQLKEFTTSDVAYHPRRWLSPNPRDNETARQTDIRYSSDGHSLVIAGFESPVHSGRSVIMIAAAQPGDLSQVRYAFDRGDPDSPRLQGSLAVVRDQAVIPLVAETHYFEGHLGWKKRLEWELSQYWPGMPPIDTMLRWAAVFLLCLIVLGLWRIIAHARRPRR